MKIGKQIFYSLAIFTLGLMLSARADAYCGALCNYELGTPDMGSSGAGATARAEDAGTAYFNPAGMTRIEGTEMMLGTAVFLPNLEFEQNPSTTVSVPAGNLNDGGKIDDLVFGSNAYMVKSLSEDLKLGFALNSFDAGAVDYDDGWVGRNFITEDKFFVLNIEPAVALRLTDWLSVGAGINVLYG